MYARTYTQVCECELCFVALEADCGEENRRSQDEGVAISSKCHLWSRKKITQHSSKTTQHIEMDLVHYEWKEIEIINRPFRIRNRFASAALKSEVNLITYIQYIQAGVYAYSVRISFVFFVGMSSWWSLVWISFSLVGVARPPQYCFGFTTAVSCATPVVVKTRRVHLVSKSNTLNCLSLIVDFEISDRLNTENLNVSYQMEKIRLYLRGDIR